MQNVVLNKEQKKAVQHGEGPLLIIAGAGTGKTTVITERIKHLILKKKIVPKNILALTFTEKAATEMQERIDTALPYGYADMWIHTFHGFCDRVLRKDAIHIGLSTNYQLLTEAESILFLRKHLFDFNLDYFRPLGNPDKFLQGLLQHFSRLQDEDITPQQYEDFVEKQIKRTDDEMTEDYKQQLKELSHAYTIYEKLKIQSNFMDFSDLISNTLQLFRKRKHILHEYQKQFMYLLVDEFQDTNFAQNQLAILLAGGQKNITAVGDDDQAIYRWRGAALSNMMHFRKHFPKTKIITLIQNYRSTQVVLDTAYQVIQHNNPDRLEVKEKINKHLTAIKKVKQQFPVTFLQQEREDLEAEKVVEEIQRLHGKGYAYKDFAILVRANDHADSFLRSLSRHTIPHQFLGPSKLFHQEEIKDLIAYLKVLYNNEDAQALYRVLTIPVFKIPADDISLLLNFSKKKNVTLFESLQNLSNLNLSVTGEKGIEKIQKLFSKHQEMVSKETAGRILYDFLEQSGLISQYLRITTENDDIKAKNTSKFFEKLKQFEIHNEDASVYAVVDWIDITMQLGDSPLAADVDIESLDGVNILTVHASKGLEFPVVFIVSLVTQRFPSRERSDQIPISDFLIKEELSNVDYHTQEERRLFYVALTRAKERIFLTASKIYGEGKRERKISPFIMEALGNTVNTTMAEPVQLQQLFSKEKLVAKDTLKPLKITYVSYSQIQTFDICPLHYKLHYLLHVPTPPQPALNFGISIHATLREFYERAMQGETISKNDIPNIFDSFWTTEGYHGRQHAQAAYAGGLTMLTKYIEKNFTPKKLPIALEHPFQFSLGGIRVGGRMDRIDRLSDGSIEIIDYKTGRNSIEEKQIKNNLQLSLYTLAAKNIPEVPQHTNISSIKVSLHYIETGKIVSGILTKEDLENASKKILAKVKEIETSNFACSKSIFCQNCEYKMLCQAQI